MSCVVLMPLAPWTHLPTLAGVGWGVAGGALVGVTAAWMFVRGMAEIAAEHAALLAFLGAADGGVRGRDCVR